MHEDDLQSSSLFKGGRACGPGMVRRKGHIATRKVKTILGRLLKRGTTYRVKSHCVKGEASKAPTNIIGPLKKGSLTDLGYSASDSSATRRASLSKAVGKYGRLSTYRKLNAVATLTKNTAPAKAAVFKADRDWVKKTYF
jgi:Family of unknown function (DUF5771)